MDLKSIKAVAVVKEPTVRKASTPTIGATRRLAQVAELVGCENCILQGKAKVDPEFRHADYAVILPKVTNFLQTRAGYSENLYYSDKGGSMFKQVLSQMGMKVTDMYTTFAVKCYMPKDVNPLPCATSCSDILLAELLEIKPKVVLAFGVEAMKSLFSDSSLSKKQGLLVWHPKLNAYVIPCYSPDEVMEKPELFRDFIDALQQFSGAPLEKLPDHGEPDLEVVYCYEQLRDIIALISTDTHVAVDIETTGLNPLYDRVISIGFCYDGKKSYIIPTEFLETDEKMLKCLRSWFERPTFNGGGHNACQFDSKMLYKKYNIDWMPKWDTLYAHYCVDERQYGHGLKVLASKYLNAPHYSEAMEAIDYKNGKTMADEDPMLVYTYQAWDCIYTHRLKPLLDKLMEEEGTKPVHDDILVPGGNSFRDIELYGTLVDVPYLRKLQITYEKEIAEDLAVVQQMALEKGMPDFNPNSPPQVKKLLFEKFNVPKGQWGKTGKDELEVLAPKYPIVDRILRLRTKMRIKTGYIDSLIDKVDPNTGRVYPQFLLFGTQTGRLSCINPNIQNQPMMVGSAIRYAFMARPGYTLIEGDFNQLELKVLAWITEDADLIDVFVKNEDIHSKVGEKIFKKPASEISKQERYKAKLINFGLAYGRSAKSLAAQPEFNSTVEQAQQYMNDFFSHYKGVTKWIKSIHEFATKEGYVKTAFSRKRRFPLLTSSNVYGAMRQAQNSPIQGTASDLCLTALTRVHMALKENSAWNKAHPTKEQKVSLEQATILFTVHDAIMLEVKQGYEQQIAELLWQKMVEEAPLKAEFKFTIDVAKGDRWGTLEHFYPVKEDK